MSQKSKTDEHKLQPTPLDLALKQIRPAIVTAFVIGFFVTLFSFAGSLYMIQVYERALGSRNITTLVVLTMIVVFILIVDAVLHGLRDAMMRRAAVAVDHQIAGPLFEQVHRAILAQDRTDAQATMADLGRLRSFIGGSAFGAMTEFLYVPIFFVVLYLFHPLLAALVAVGAAFVAILTWVSSVATQEASRHESSSATEAGELVGNLFRNFETVQALGMRRALRDRWLMSHTESLGWSVTSDKRAAIFTVLINFLKHAVQTLALGLTAYLVIQGQVSPAVIFAASVIVGRTFGPVAAIISNWRAITGARESYTRIQALFHDLQTNENVLALPTPAGRLTLEGVAIAPPGAAMNKAVLNGVTIDLPAGSVLAAIGPSAAGKTTLLKTIIGVWRPLVGEVRIDGSALTQWDDESLGQHMGYLAPEVDLFPGTVAQNIARFRNVPDADIIEAAKRAFVHEMILQLPDGYNTMINKRGGGLSSGQRQRIGLARALFGNPRIIVLDEPNAILDAAGENNLMQTIRTLRSEGRTVVFVTHKVSLVQVADYVLVLGGGGVREFGPRDKVMQKITEPKLVSTTPRAAQAS